MVDYFSYPTYNGNQLTAIFDYANSQNLSNTKEYQDKNHVYGATNEMAYDANGNLTKDLDRDIVTIRYNLLNLPEIVQFKNGNQIKNLYDAGGQKLRSDYFTQLVALSAPVTEGQTLQQNYIANVVNQSGTLYINNKEYKYSGSQGSVYTINQIHNPEGYVFFEGSPMYNYFRRDHLGNIREVWQANRNSTVQRTQYYPSGLPWASNFVDNPGTQSKKYNGKEFVEMHGLDEYDSEARWYYPAIMRTTTIDPLAEKFYDISQYAWCSNNPVNRIDPDGRADWKVIGRGALITLGGVGSLAGAAVTTPTGFGIPAAAYLAVQGVTAVSFGIGQMLVGAVSEPTIQTKNLAASMPSDMVDAVAITLEKHTGNENIRTASQVVSLVSGAGVSEVAGKLPTVIQNATRVVSAVQAVVLGTDLINTSSNNSSQNVNVSIENKEVAQPAGANYLSPLKPEIDNSKTKLY